MDSAMLTHVLQVLEELARLELAVGAFYRCCAELDMDNARFWSFLQGQETGHARDIKAMMALIEAAPGQYAPRRNISLATIKTVLDGVETKTVELRHGMLPLAKAIFVARDLEGSILETKHHEVVQTSNAEYLRLVAKILCETAEHKKLIEQYPRL